MIWQSLIGPKYAHNYLQSKLTAIEAFYNYIETNHPLPTLDQLLFELDLSNLELRLKGFLARLQNEAVLREIDNSKTCPSSDHLRQVISIDQEDWSQVCVSV